MPPPASAYQIGGVSQFDDTSSQDRGRFRRHISNDPANPNPPTDMTPDRRHLSIVLAFVGGLVVLGVLVLIATLVL